jgi:protein TonB
VPTYTRLARSRKIEGEVLLEVRFPASGEATVLRVVRGLGYGLDESAEAAAQQIQFWPARDDQGLPVDSTDIVHIVFALAY